MKVLLDTQSSYSLLWGTVPPERLLQCACDLGYTHLALTDHANLYALPIALEAAEGLPIRLIVGASFPLDDATSPVGASASLVALVETQRGYANLCRLISRVRTRNRPPVLPDPEHFAETAVHLAPEAQPPVCSVWAMREALADCTGGLIFLTNSPDLVHWLQDADAQVYWRLGPALVAPPPEMRQAGVPMAVAPQVMMHDATEHDLHRLLRRIASPRGEPRFAPPESFLQPPEVYARRFGVFPEALVNAANIAERAGQFSPDRSTLFPPAPCDGPAEAELRRLAYDGARTRYGDLSDRIAARLEYELGMIHRKGFCEYFLVVNDIVRHSPRTCGRGSGAASLVNYCLGVTNVDPIRHDLMFERFLNPGRIDPPDIDVDFAWDERDLVLANVFRTYGLERTAMVANHLTFQPRSALRDTARVFGLTDEEITRGIAQLPELRNEYSPLPVIERAPASSSPPSQSVTMPPPWDRIVKYAQRLLGLPRGLSLHCGGVVMTPGPLTERVPVETAAKGLPVIQWEKDGTEFMGLVKIDLLGNRSLAVIRDAVHAAAHDHGVAPEAIIPQPPTDDEAAQTTLAAGRTMGVFYVESPAMRQLQLKTGVGDFEHLVIHSSIIRPAANDYIQEYVARLRGKPWRALHPRLEGVLDETLGLPVYQEDVSKMLIALAGYDHTEADRFRKCLGKRNARELLEQRHDEFVQRCRDGGVDDRTIARAWDTFLSMTGYSFCKPHSASYAQVSFESAYLRAHYPAEFMAAVLSNGGGYYSAQGYISEALRMGLPVRGPDANRSAWAYRAEQGGVRVGLMAIRGLKREAALHLVAEREQHGPYASLPELIQRTDLEATDLQRLGAVGALDELAPGLNRPQILWLATRLRKRHALRDTLFPPPPPTPPDLPPFSVQQRREHEYAELGFLVNDHPLSLYEPHVAAARRSVTPSLALEQHVGEVVTLLAWPVTAKVVSTHDRQPMEFVSFEDYDGIYETVLFPKTYARFARLVHQARPLLVTGLVTQEWDALSVLVRRVEPVPGTEAGLPTDQLV